MKALIMGAPPFDKSRSAVLEHRGRRTSRLRSAQTESRVTFLTLISLVNNVWTEAVLGGYWDMKAQTFLTSPSMKGVAF